MEDISDTSDGKEEGFRLGKSLRMADSSMGTRLDASTGAKLDVLDKSKEGLSVGESLGKPERNGSSEPSSSGVLLGNISVIGSDSCEKIGASEGELVPSCGDSVISALPIVLIDGTAVGEKLGVPEGSAPIVEIVGLIDGPSDRKTVGSKEKTVNEGELVGSAEAKIVGFCETTEDGRLEGFMLGLVDNSIVS